MLLAWTFAGGPMQHAERHEAKANSSHDTSLTLKWFSTKTYNQKYFWRNSRKLRNVLCIRKGEISKDEPNNKKTRERLPFKVLSEWRLNSKRELTRGRSIHRLTYVRTVRYARTYVRTCSRSVVVRVSAFRWPLNGVTVYILRVREAYRNRTVHCSWERLPIWQTCVPSCAGAKIRVKLWTNQNRSISGSPGWKAGRGNRRRSPGAAGRRSIQVGM